jgi:Lrp/AsnC family transcriptional regulator, regulator of ectoine-degradation genes
VKQASTRAQAAIARLKLDAIDLKILAALQREGRITKIKLAQEVGLSISPCLERMRRLERAGFVRGYRAELDLAKLLSASTIYVEVTLKGHTAADFERFERAIAAAAEVVECDAIGGGIDYLMKVVATDIDHYQQIIERLLNADIGIGKYFTYIVTKKIKRAPYPLRELLEKAKRPSVDS